MENLLIDERDVDVLAGRKWRLDKNGYVVNDRSIDGKK